jgi:hypothetical protein
MDTPRFTILSSYVILDLRNFIRVKKIVSNHIFETRTEFFPAGMKSKWDEGGGRVLLGDNTGGRAVML